MLNVLRQLREVIKQFRNDGNNGDIMSLWATYTITQESCENPDFFATRTLIFTLTTTGVKITKQINITSTVFTDFVKAQMLSRPNGGDAQKGSK